MGDNIPGGNIRKMESLDVFSSGLECERDEYAGRMVRRSTFYGYTERLSALLSKHPIRRKRCDECGNAVELAGGGSTVLWSCRTCDRGE